MVTAVAVLLPLTGSLSADDTVTVLVNWPGAPALTRTDRWMSSLGMSDGVPRTSERVWDPGSDLMVLFTDGMTDARNRFDKRFGEEAVLDVVRAHRTASTKAILDQVLASLQQHTGDVQRRDDLTMVVARA